MQEKKTHELENGQIETKEKIEASMIRWYVLLMTIAYSGINAFQWPQYTIITDLTKEYYGVDNAAMEWTSIVFFVLFPFQVLPFSYIFDKMGLRISILLAVLTTALGTLIKIFSVGRDLFYLVMIGQVFVGAGQIFVLCLPSRIAGVWFKANEVSTVNAMCLFGNQFGSALGFLLIPLIVRRHVSLDDSATELQFLCYGLAAAIAPIVLAVIFYLPAKPKKPPNRTQLQENRCEEVKSFIEFVKSLKVLFLNKGFLLVSIASGINFSVQMSLGNLLNEFVLHYFEHAEEDAGRMGMSMVGIGTFGSIIVGTVLDKTHKYKENSIITYFVVAAGMVCFVISLEFHSMIGAYLAITIYGLFSNAFITVGIEFAVEMTFPVKESTTSCMLFLTGEVMTVIFTFLGGVLIRSVGVLWSLVALTVLVLVGAITTIFIPSDLRRQKVLQGTDTVKKMSIS